MQLFELDSFNVVFSPQALLLKPFKKLWDRDKTKDKHKAVFELGYVWYMEDYKSDFIDLIDPNVRKENVLQALNVPKGWKPDKLTLEAQEFYKSFYQHYISYQALSNARLTLQKVSEFITKVNPDERTANGGIVFNIKQLADTAKQIPQMLEAIKECEAVLKKDLEVDSGMRGNSERNPFEEGI